MVREQQSHYASQHTQLLIGGITLCLLCPTPLFAAAVLPERKNEWAVILAMVLLLTMVGIGVLCIVRTCIVWGTYQQLLEEGDYTREHKQEERRNSAISSIYWGTITVIYLGYSFIVNSWERSWIIWPVAGVCYGVLISVLRVLRKNQQ